MNSMNSPIEYLTLVSEVERRANQLAAINTVASAISQSLDLNQTLETALENVLSVIPVTASGISLVDENRRELVMRAQRGWKRDFVSNPMRIPIGDGMSGQVISENQVMLAGDVGRDPRLAVHAVAEEGFQAMAMAPMHAHGKVIGVLSVMSNDPYIFSDDQITVLCAIADQVGVALDNARLYEDARDQQSRLLAVLQSTADAIIALDSQHRVTLINAAATQWLGLTGDDIGKPLSELILPPEISDRLLTLFSALPEHNPCSFDAKLPSDRFLSVILSAVGSVEGAPIGAAGGYVLVFQDITHLKQVEYARLTFVQQAAHDLRNPLGVVISALAMLSRDSDGTQHNDREILDIAMRSVNRMQELIDDMLHLEKLGSGVDFHPVLTDLGAILIGCAQDISPTLQKRDQKLAVDLAPDLPAMYVDPHWLVRALMNMLSNASKYTQEGGTITLSLEADQGNATGNVMIAVSDNGPGIPAEAQPRLFERFYRAPNTARTVSGTGLGLAIVKLVAELHHGHADVASAPGKGSRFSITLPITAAEAEARQNPIDTADISLP